MLEIVQGNRILTHDIALCKKEFAMELDLRTKVTKAVARHCFYFNKSRAVAVATFVKLK